MEDIVQSRSREDRDRRDDAENREPGFQSALADHHQEIGDARHEQRHHRQRDDRLHAGQLTAVRELEQPGGAVIAAQETHDENLRGRRPAARAGR